MKQVIQSTKFKKDLERMKKRGKNRDELLVVLTLLQSGKAIPLKYKDHALTGNWLGYRDVHVENDWLLIYEATDESVFLARTGTHSDLF
jgi:mRNA interferase YafQ